MHQDNDVINFFYKREAFFRTTKASSSRNSGLSKLRQHNFIETILLQQKISITSNKISLFQINTRFILQKKYKFMAPPLFTKNYIKSNTHRSATSVTLNPKSLPIFRKSKKIRSFENKQLC